LPQCQPTGSIQSLRSHLPHKLTRLDSISEGIETQSTTSSINVNQTDSNSSDVDDAEHGPADTASSQTSALVLAAITQQLREHSNDAVIARREVEEMSEKVDKDMAKHKADARETRQEMVETLACARSKADCLQRKLDSRDVIIAQYAYEAKDHKSKMQSKDKAQFDAEMKLEEQMIAWKEHQNLQEEDLQKQVWTAVEASKLACGRAEDFRQEIESLKARHAHELEIVRISNAAADGQTGSSASIVLDLQEQVRHLTEERNELQNTLEWREIQWRTKVEDLETKLVMQGSTGV